ncbi:MAG TPA: hydrogenase maturation nickel metallochaperone HypA [Acidimicrobiia bacterium]|nr:hydrogenase maturation nickel metallochaperone HypA [Acidimicrobiia bacterium]
MHERGVAADLVRTAGVVALEQGAGRVRTLRVRIGASSHVDPDSLAAQVSWHAKGTIVEGAEVIVERRVLPTGAVPGRDDNRVMLVSVDLEE